MKGKILIADQLHERFKERATEMGYEVTDLPDITREEALQMIPRFDGIAIRTKFGIDKEFLDAGVNLKFVARAGAGLDNIDTATADERHIQLINAPEGNADAVGEHAVGMLLALMNKLTRADLSVRNGVWDREGHRGIGLRGKTVGIIGYGHMGQHFAQKLVGFGVQVIAYDKYKTGFSDTFVQEVSMEELVKKVDVLSLHIPLTRETRKMVDEEYLFHFKKPIILINTARGEIVDTASVLSALNSGKILYAGLDVLETEKFPALATEPWFKALSSDERVLLSPHVAGWTVDSYLKISEVLADKLENLVF